MQENKLSLYNIFAIVVTYNGNKWVDKCFGSLLESTIPLRILVIDNESTDGTPEIIKRKFPNIELIEAGENLGFGKANNLGLKIAYKNRADYAFLLNQDAWIEPNTIEKLIDVSKKNKEYGVLSPVHLNGRGDAIDFNFSNYLSPSYTKKFFSDLYLNNLKEIYESRFVNAAAWLISHNCLKTVGGFNPLFKHYGEDDDYIERVYDKNLKLGVVPSARIFHDRVQTVGNNSIYNKNKEYTNALLSILNKQKLPSVNLLYRRIIGYSILNLLLPKCNNAKFRSQIKTDRNILKLLPIIKKQNTLTKNKKFL